jgi:hypothetical protein
MNLGKFDDNIRTEYFNGHGHTFNAVLFNDDGQVQKLRFGAIDELVIEDNILNWVHQGYMTLQNPDNSLERSDRVQTPSGTEKTVQFNFRSDGRDYLYLHIEPLIDDTEMRKIDNSFYTIKLIFAIYKIEDISSGESEDKKKKLYFWDYRYQYMIEKNIRWSTAHVIKTKDTNNSIISQLSDKDRSLPPGTAIRELLHSVFDEHFGDATMLDGWEEGSDSNKIFYSSPNNYKAADDIQYLLNQHASSDETGSYPCILRLERDMKHTWSLLSLPGYFKRGTSTENKAGVYQLEKFVISHLPDSSSPIPNRPKVPTDSTTVQNVHLPDLSVINDFEFVQQDGLVNQRKMVTTAVHGYSFEEKTFNLYQHDISDVQDEFQKDIVDLAYSSGEENCKANFFLNKLKIDNLNIRSINSTAGSHIDGLTWGRNKTMINGLLTGNTVLFECKGGTHRQAGRFIGVDRSDHYDENKFDDKVLGQYFTVAVNHVFTPSRYDNDIIAVKPFAFKDAQYREENVV